MFVTGSQGRKHEGGVVLWQTKYKKIPYPDIWVFPFFSLTFVYLKCWAHLYVLPDLFFITTYHVQAIFTLVLSSVMLHQVKKKRDNVALCEDPSQLTEKKTNYRIHHTHTYNTHHTKKAFFSTKRYSLERHSIFKRQARSSCIGRQWISRMAMGFIGRKETKAKVYQTCQPSIS